MVDKFYGYVIFWKDDICLPSSITMTTHEGGCKIQVLTNRNQNFVLLSIFFPFLITPC